MLDFIKGKKNHFIGVDFGASSIKVVELSYKNQKIHLENYGVVDFDWSNQNKGYNRETKKDSSYEKKVNDLLKKLVDKMNIGSEMDSYVSIPGFSGLITIIEMPDMQSEDLAKAIQFEAHKYIPSSLDEIAMSWEVIGHVSDKNSPNKPGENIEKKVKVLLVAAPKRDIERYSRFVSETKLKVCAIELETFSIVRSLIGEDVGNFFIIDIGFQATNIVLVEKGVVILNRNIDVGGDEITLSISDSMKISKQRAESFKRGEKDILNNRESGIIIPALELIANEARRILNTYKEKNKEMKIDGIMLSGGTSKMKGIEEYFSSLLGARVVRGNPWRNISFPPSASSLVKDLGPSFSVVLGLALRGVEEYRRD